MNGFKNKTQASSSYTQGRSYESSKKKSYKSLQDSNYSGDTLKVSKQRTKEGRKDPYRLSTQQFSRFEVEGDVGDDRFMELRPVETLVNKHTQSAHGETGDSQSHHSGEPPVTIVVSSPVMEDSSSDKAILDEHYMKST